MGHSKPILRDLSSRPVSEPGADLKSAHLANIARLQARRMVDPDVIYAEFPDRWQRYLHDTFTSPAKVARAFSVSEKAAKKWWDGIGGPHGDKVAYAVRTDPDAHRYLFAAE